MIEEIRKKLKMVKQHDLIGADLHIKIDEITYIDHNRKIVYKRVFRTDLEGIQESIRNLPVAAIKETAFSESSSEFILEYIQGHDVFLYMKLHPEKAEETLIYFENFLDSWFNFSPDKDYLYCSSFDVNPGNFIINPENFEIKKIDYLSDWMPGKRDLSFYLLPFQKILEHRLVRKELVEDLINKRFKSKGLNFENLVKDMQKNLHHTYKSIS